MTACAVPLREVEVCAPVAESTSDEEGLFGLELGLEDLPLGRTVVAIQIVGNEAVSSATVRRSIETSIGDGFDETSVAADVRRLWRLEVFEDVHVRAVRSGEGVKLVYEVAERPVVSAVQVATGHDATSMIDDREAAPFRALPGAIFDPARIRRMEARAEHGLNRLGHLRPRVAVHATRTDAAVQLCVELQAGPRHRIESIEFDVADASEAALPAGTAVIDELRPLLGGDEVNVVGGIYRPDLMEEARARVLAALYERGRVSAFVGEPEVDVGDDVVTVRLPLTLGASYRIRRAEVVGAEPLDAVEALVGELFVRSEVMSALERVQARERSGGRAVVVTPETTLEVVQGEGLVDLRFVVDDPPDERESTEARTP